MFPEHRESFERLANGQSPHTLFITCSDSRIDPALLTQSVPGELFVVRNAGNIVPPYGAGDGGGEGATIEYAVAALGVTNIVVCGHSHCGAMKGLLHPEAVTEMPQVASWLRQAETTRRLVQAFGRGEDSPAGALSTATHEEEDLLAYAVERNVLAQMGNLRTHPAVAAALALDKVHLYGWVYHLENGHVDAYDPATDRFVSLTAAEMDAPPRQV
ncbi:MAG: carbonic anhydrase [Cytophagales bacterium]|nr:carbonic anhydrase [Armatimonadota bacterium]